MPDNSNLYIFNGVEWGLAQVLIEMNVADDPEQVLQEFITVAERMLKWRVEHDPRPEIEAKGLPGWRSRLNKYSCVRC